MAQNPHASDASHKDDELRLTPTPPRMRLSTIVRAGERVGITGQGQFKRVESAGTNKSRDQKTFQKSESKRPHHSEQAAVHRLDPPQDSRPVLFC